MRRAILAATVALSLTFGGAPIRAQEPAPVAEAPAAAPDAWQQTTTYAAQSGPPRTLRAYWHVFAAFAFAWVCILGYAVSLGRRFRRLEGQVDALAGERPTA
jgi:CcmD family protein